MKLQKQYSKKSKERLSNRESPSRDISFFSSFFLLGIFLLYNIINYFFLDPSCGIKENVLCANFIKYLNSLEFFVVLLLFVLFFIIHLFMIYIMNQQLSQKPLNYNNGGVIIISELILVFLMVEIISVINYVELLIVLLILLCVLLLFEFKQWSVMQFFISTVLIFFVYLWSVDLAGFIVIIVLFTVLNMIYILGLGYGMRRLKRR